MNAKLKGLFKGLRYISSIFEEEEEEEIVIGLPTDVKHVGHVGWEGPAGGSSATTVEASPSWMKKFSASEEVKQSVKSNVGGTKENYEILGNFEDSELKPSKSKGSSRESQEMAKSGRRVAKELHDTDSPKKDKQRDSRRRSSKEKSENGISSNKHLQLHDEDLGPGSSPSRNTKEAPRRHRRKKSKENLLDSSRSKSKGHDGLDGLDDRQSSMNSVATNDSPRRTLAKERKEYNRQLL